VSACRSVHWRSLHANDSLLTVTVSLLPLLLALHSLLLTRCRSLLAVVCSFVVIFLCSLLLSLLAVVRFFACCHCLCLLSLSLLAVVVFARCRCLRSLLLSSLAVIVFACCHCLRLLSLSSLTVVVFACCHLFLCSLLFVSLLNVVCFFAQCRLAAPSSLFRHSSLLYVVLLCSLLLDIQIGALVSIWSLVLCSFSCFFALFGGGLRFFAQWRRSSLKVVGRLDRSEQVISLLISSFLVLQLGY